MNNQPCNEVATWTCRQPALSQEQPMLMTRAQASSAVVPAGTVHDGALVQSFVPGVVAHYLTHQDFPITRELAVVFVDLVNSTRVLSQQPPAQALTLIQHFTELVTEIAVAHCGDVKDYEGDGALLYFASIVNATRAALAIRTALEALHTPDGQVVQARFSLNVGEVTIGVIGSATRRSVALIGPTVHLAARLLKHVTPGGIIAPQTVIDRLQQEAPTVAQDFRLLGKCLTIRDFEEQCVTAYSLPANSPESQLVEGYRPKAEGPPLFSLYSLKPQASPRPLTLNACSVAKVITGHSALLVSSVASRIPVVCITSRISSNTLAKSFMPSRWLVHR
jgi:class 3 adenylate cyclase